MKTMCPGGMLNTRYKPHEPEQESTEHVGVRGDQRMLRVLRGHFDDR
jgi:hypothetical protein